MPDSSFLCKLLLLKHTLSSKTGTALASIADVHLGQNDHDYTCELHSMHNISKLMGSPAVTAHNYHSCHMMSGKLQVASGCKLLVTVTNVHVFGQHTEYLRVKSTTFFGVHHISASQ